MGEGETERPWTYNKDLTCSKENTDTEKVKKSVTLPKTQMKYTNFQESLKYKN